MSDFTTMRIRKDVLRDLKTLAKANKRSMANLVEVWVDREIVRSASVSAETVASDPAVMLKPEERAKIGV